ncbi:MAG: hypothetical protein DMH00_08775 [Acidobacteria bacterium]|nr:MAG: hypothetical protein DMH00_08775 [Acidobacteriota bacterium]
MVHKSLKPSYLVRILSLSSPVLLLLPAGTRASTPPPVPPAPPAHAAAAKKPATPAPAPEPADSEDDAARTKHAWLGVVLSEGEDGVSITGVKEQSPADKAGLREGDTIVEIDSKKVEDSGDIRRAIRELEPGDTVQIVVMRDGKKKTVNATLGEAPAHFWRGEGFPGLAPGEGFGPMGFRSMALSRTYLGVRVQGMTEELRTYFKAPRGRGVLVSRVEEDTPAARAGLRAGDVIVMVDGKGIASRGDIGEALVDKEPGDKVAVKVIRDGADKTLDVEVSERPTPKARHGHFMAPGRRPEQGLDEDEEDSDVPEMEALPDGSRIRLEIDQAMKKAEAAVKDSLPQGRDVEREIERAMQASAMSQRDVEKEVQQTMQYANLSKLNWEAMSRQIREAMEQYREALRQAAEASRFTMEDDAI